MCVGLRMFVYVRVCLRMFAYGCVCLCMFACASIDCEHWCVFVYAVCGCVWLRLFAYVCA